MSLCQVGSDNDGNDCGVNDVGIDYDKYGDLPLFISIWLTQISQDTLSRKNFGQTRMYFDFEYVNIFNNSFLSL